MARTFELITPLGADVLLFHRLQAREELSRLSEFQLDALSTKADINVDDILGKNVTGKGRVGGQQPEALQRLCHPLCTGRDARALPRVSGECPAVGMVSYSQGELPHLPAEDRAGHSQENIQRLSRALGHQVRGHGNYRTWDYCVQYRETDFNFVSRLMEQEGIYYYFKYQEGRNTLVVADSYSAHSALPGCEQLPFIPQERMTRPEQERISTWSFEREIQPGRYVLDDYDSEKPSVELQVKTNFKREHANADYEFYDYPGEYLKKDEGEQYVRTRIEELHAQFELAQGQTNARGLSVGYLVKLTGQPRADQNREYLVVSTQQSAWNTANMNPWSKPEHHTVAASAC